MNAPHTPTLTINMEDNPLTFTLERDIRGTLQWRIHWDPALLTDPNVVRHAVLQLNLTSTTWFYQQYGVIGPDGQPVDFNTDAGKELLDTFTTLHQQSTAALAEYQRLLAETADE